MLDLLASMEMLGTLDSQGPRDRRENWERRDTEGSKERQAIQDSRDPRATGDHLALMGQRDQLER